MFRVHAGVVDYAILAVYFAVVLGIGLRLRFNDATHVLNSLSFAASSEASPTPRTPPPRRTPPNGSGGAARWCWV